MHDKHSKAPLVTRAWGSGFSSPIMLEQGPLWDVQQDEGGCCGIIGITELMSLWQYITLGSATMPEVLKALACRFSHADSRDLLRNCLVAHVCSPKRACTHPLLLGVHLFQLWRRWGLRLNEGGVVLGQQGHRHGTLEGGDWQDGAGGRAYQAISPEIHHKNTAVSLILV